MKVKQFIKQETVLSVAIVLAAISAVFVPPDAGYISYIAPPRWGAWRGRPAAY